MEAG
jgi:hypothetical protein